ncbi:S-layer homology domain-containing protein [Cohnella sp. LGH]|uniref:S-layer homology domain-containing protein n=1 Tax=Cohnella sp. LGH TaxID=1619153 RepID=UPI001AD9696B|nr:S-layer homology domain-containing protein [Cohnella sp. LGH]QTH41528.1 S-layer homology domain-containing protein [Cohnella sp. LGH]
MSRKPKKWISILLCFSLFVSAFNLSGPAYAAQAGDGGSLVKNSDFSQGEANGSPLHWTMSGSPSYVLDQPGITVEGNSGEGLSQEWISITPGHKYKLFAQIQVLQGAMNFSAYMVNDQWQFSDDQFFDQKRPADGLVTIEKEFIAKSDSTRISVRLLAGENDTEYRIVDTGMYDLGPAANMGANLLQNGFFDQLDNEEELEAWATTGSAAYQVEETGVTVSANNGDGLQQEWIDVIPGHKYLITAQVQVHQGALSILGYGINSGWSFSEAPFFDQKRPADGLVTVKKEFVASDTTVRYSFRLYAGEPNSSFTIMKAGMYDLGVQQNENLNILQNPLLNTLDGANQLISWSKSGSSSYEVTSAGLKVSANAGEGIAQEWINIIPGNKYVLTAHVQVDQGELNFSGYAIDNSSQFVDDPFFDQLRPSNGQVMIQKEFIAPSGATGFGYRLTANTADTKFTVLKAGMYDLGSTLPGYQSDALQQFEEDFSNGHMLWDTSGDEGSWKEIDGKLQSITYKNSSAKLKGMQANWGDQVISFKFKRVATPGENHMGVRFRVTGSDFSWLLIRDGGLSIMHSGSGEQPFYSFPFDLGKEYAIQLVVQGNKLDVYLKPPEVTEFSLAASLTGVPERSGTIQFTSYNIQAAFDDVTISTLDEPEFAFISKINRVSIGGSKQLQLWNETGTSNVIWESSNPLVATVFNGAVIGISRGSATITARTSDNSYSDSADVFVTASPSAISLNLSSSTIYVGESQEFIASFNPSNVDNTATVWESSNPAAISLHGSSDKKRAIHGEAVGQSTITVRALDGGHIASATINVINLPSGVPDSIMLKLGNRVKNVPENFFGVNDGLAFNIRPNELYNTNKHVQMLSEIKFQHVRGPGGMDGNLYLYDEGVLPTNSADQAKMLQVYGQDLMNSLSWMPTNLAEADKLTLDKVLKLANDMDKPYIFDLNIIAYTPEEIVDQVTAIKEELNPGQELFVELGNELYDNSYRYPFPTVTDYIAKSKAVAEALRDEHPDVKIGIVSIDQGFVDFILADSGNRQKPGQSLEDYLATQGGRVSIWNSELLKDQSFFDAVIIHYYNHVEELAGISNTKLYEYLFKENELRKITAEATLQLFPGKEAWITEWGLLPMFMFGESDSMDRARYQFAKTEGMAALYVDMIFNMLDIDEISMTSYYVANDPQGFGLLQTVGTDEYVRLPAFYALKEIGNLLDDYEKYYEIDLSNVTKLHKTQDRTNLPVEVPEVSAWGMGDDDGIQKLIISNRTNRTVDIELEGYELQPLWSYGGADALPDFLINPNPSWTDVPTSITLPDALDGNTVSHYEVEPYSIMIAKVIPTETNPGSGNPSTGTGSTTGPVSAPTNPIVSPSGKIIPTEYTVAVGQGVHNSEASIVTIPAAVWQRAVEGAGKNQEQITIQAEQLKGDFEIVLPYQYVADALKANQDQEIEVKYAGGSFKMAIRGLSKNMPESGVKNANYHLAIQPSSSIPNQADRSVEWLVSPTRISVAIVSDGATTLLNDFNQTYVRVAFELNNDTNADELTGVIVDPVTGELTYVPATVRITDDHKEIVLKYTGIGQFAVVSVKKSFSDVQGHWSQVSVENLASKLLVKGVTDQLFNPNGKITRAEFTVLLTRAMGLQQSSGNSFSDVADDSWYAGAVKSAVQAGLIRGLADGTFNPRKLITREQAAVMFERALRFNGAVADHSSGSLQQFADLNQISAYANQAMQTMVQYGIIQGANNKLSPKNNATRAEIAVMLMNIMRYFGD